MDPILTRSFQLLGAGLVLLLFGHLLNNLEGLTCGIHQ